MRIEITNGGSFKCLIEVLEDGSVKVLGAINGWGNSCIEDVSIEVLQSSTELE